MKILLTGGTGVLSTDIAKLAIEKGIDVYLLNRGSKKEFFPEKSNIIIADLRNVNDVKFKIKDLYFDVVIDFLSFNTNHLKNTLSIFNGKCDQFIFISSATAYQHANIITENTPLGNENWSYAQNKYECEKLLLQNYELTGQKYTIVRPYVTYGKTRIPFAIIPHDKQWSLANRILSNKPIVLWDNGQAICTLTNTIDFAIGIIGLFKNPKAYQEDFHITTDQTLTWHDALLDIGKALHKTPKIASIPSSFIYQYMPEYKGILLGDKGRNMIFDNSKIKSVVPNFNCNISFEDGIKETISFYKKNDSMRSIDYEWDARIDNLIYKYYHDNFPPEFDKNSISIKSYNYPLSLSNIITYILCRYDILYPLFKFYKFSKRIFNKIVRTLKKLI